ncbi:hypothetical protein BC628DRAFT_1385161 [Trametes gibbosa]|nr:hypothetical protein BC628DRAFT_1385161 [Trametes gibbosa]
MLERPPKEAEMVHRHVLMPPSSPQAEASVPFILLRRGFRQSFFSVSMLRSQSPPPS